MSCRCVVSSTVRFLLFDLQDNRSDIWYMNTVLVRVFFNNSVCEVVHAHVPDQLFVLVLILYVPCHRDFLQRLLHTYAYTTTTIHLVIIVICVVKYCL